MKSQKKATFGSILCTKVSLEPLWVHEYLTDLIQMMKILGLVSYKDFRQARDEPVPAVMLGKYFLF